MAKKYYAVRKGKSTGIYENWDECKKQVMGYSGAIYKSFPSLEEAKEFMNAGQSSANSGNDSSTSQPVIDENTAAAYVDGSYNPRTHEYSCGAILFYKGKEVTFSEKYSDPEMADMRNVAGEIMGAAEVIEYCLKENIKSLVIYHDYEGVAQWANGSWKANKTGTKAYAQACLEARKNLKLDFCKVKGHSGDKYNDAADALAKKALGLI